MCFILLGMPSAAFAWDHPNKANAQEAYQKLLGLGYTPQAAAGLLGNAETESGFNPGSVQAGDPTWLNSVKASPCGTTNPGGEAIGFFQWDGGRAVNMLCHWSKEGKKWDTIDSALQYIEIENSQANQFGPKGIDGFKKMTNVREATEYFMSNWERCGQCHAERRYIAADGIYADFKDLKPIKLGESASSEKAKSKEKHSAGGGAVLDEWELKGMPQKPKWADGTKIEDKSSKDLSSGDNYAIQQIKEDLTNNKKHWVDNLNVGVSFVGLLIIIWGLFIWLAGIFDHVNNFIKIDLVKKLTFGRFEYTSDPDMLEKGMLNGKGVFVRGAGAIVIGLVIISGVMMGIISDFTFFMAEFTDSLWKD